MIRRILRIAAINVVVIAMFVVTACGYNERGSTFEEDRGLKQRSVNQTGMERLNTDDLNAAPSQQTISVQIRNHDGINYIPLRDIISILEYQSEFDEEENAHLIGDNDVVYRIIVGSTEANKEEEQVQLPHPTIDLEGNTYIARESFEQLFREDLNYRFEDGRLVIFADDHVDDVNRDGSDGDLDFADDPEDEVIIDEAAWQAIIEEFANAEDLEAVDVLKKVNRSKIIATARRYLGVKYKFGAKPYAQSKRFDCSSFTQHVFKQHGVKLKRTARNQAKQGVAVSRKNLRVGDLMFFYVPGRFKSNKTVGHVGIYMGKNRMIHAGVKPKNGVQITNINKSYWKKTYLRSRRVVA